ncbi:pentatricopeptide repeat-containing protein At5g43790-like [Selaginella moellendorffii]|uniref:pentatricopeptide repeat-containing protein At5g43790-like n=1 Tax=Selaginella moellendorffii TaxID=88036 RepID=UPI000D1C933C|nr:pentatricopeptide repeat-containing protein At5g43790-like [Selaginella moellendorffii]|eukprot:XP_024541768.1 pentatricopeptide repeat-containing protein At5g43790-like [Selaginella moellendorffii]
MISGLELFQEFMASSTNRSSARSFVGAQVVFWAGREGRTAKFSGKLAAMKMVRAIFLHSEAAKRGFDLDVFVASTLVDLYAKCGSVDLARAVLDKFDHRQSSCQAAMALDVFSQMTMLDRSKREIFGTIVAAANACTSMAASEQSSRIPESIDSDGGVCVIKVETIHATARGLSVKLDRFVASICTPSVEHDRGA